MKHKPILKQIAFVLSVVILSLLVGYVATQAWTEPSQAPFGGNVPAPLNVSATAQTKSGGLQINADLSANRLLDSSNSSYYVDPANTTYAGIFAGKVGIGITSPGDNLHIFTNTTQTTPQLYIEQDGSGDAAIELGIVGDSYILGIDNSDNDNFKISYHATQGSGVLGTNDRLVITPTGNVGIGTNAPSTKLEVAGQIKITGGSPGAGKVLTSDASGLATWTTATAGVGGSGTTNYISKWTGGTTLGNSIIYDNSTNVGIGTTSPQTKLDVVGAIKIGTQATCNANSAGAIRYNSSTKIFEGCDGASWVEWSYI